MTVSEIATVQIMMEQFAWYRDICLSMALAIDRADRTEISKHADIIRADRGNIAAACIRTLEQLTGVE